jgi:hypothetical protein
MKSIDGNEIRLIMEESIKKTWENVKNRIENGYVVSSEKTLVFLFAMEFMKLNECNFEYFTLNFENSIYNEVDGSDKFLDLEIFDNNEDKKYAIEFKFPRSSDNGNSNQTETREKVYKDVARLKYLTEKKGYEKGFFIMMTNEKPYIESSENRDNTYDTSNDMEGDLSRFLEQYTISDFKFKFQWEEKAKYDYLKVIKV